MRNTPNRPNAVARSMAVEVSVCEKRLDNALFTATRSAKLREHCPEAENVRRDIRRKRLRPNKHIALVLRDAFERNSEDTDGEALGREIIAMWREWKRERDGVILPAFPEAHRLEQHIEGMSDDRTLAFRDNPSPKTYIELEEAKAAEHAADRALLETARRQAFFGINS
jgi:hypothetical protein